MPVEISTLRAVYDDPDRKVRVFYEDRIEKNHAGLFQWNVSGFSPSAGWPDLGATFKPGRYAGELGALPEHIRHRPTLQAHESRPICRAIYDQPGSGIRWYWQDGKVIACPGRDELAGFRSPWPDMEPKQWVPDLFIGTSQALPEHLRPPAPVPAGGDADHPQAIWDDPASGVRYYFYKQVLIASAPASPEITTPGTGHTPPWPDIEPSTWIGGRVIGDMNAIPKRMHARIVSRMSPFIPNGVCPPELTGTVHHAYCGAPIGTVNYDEPAQDGASEATPSLQRAVDACGGVLYIDKGTREIVLGNGVRLAVEDLERADGDPEAMQALVHEARKEINPPPGLQGYVEESIPGHAMAGASILRDYLLAQKAKCEQELQTIQRLLERAEP